jgi:hypothetical protein
MKALYSLIALSLAVLTAGAQGAEDPAGPRNKPVIDNISAGGTVIGTVNGQMVQVSDDNNTTTGGQVTPLNDTQQPSESKSEIGSSRGQASDSDQGEPEIRIYPVPATTTLLIDLGGAVASEITLLNVIGRQVGHVNSMERTVRIDVSSLDPGTYFVSIKVDGQTTTRKIQISR